MKTFGSFAIAMILYVLVAMAVVFMAENLLSAGYISDAAICWTISILGAVFFGLVASGALLIRKAGVWPSAMLSTVCLSVLDAVAILWPVAVRPSSGPARWYPMLVEQFGRSSRFDLLCAGFLLSATGAVAFLWAGFLSIPRFTVGRELVRDLTVRSVLALATGVGAVILLLLAENTGADVGEFFVSLMYLIAPCGIVLGSLSIAGTLLVAAFSLSQRNGRSKENGRESGAGAPPRIAVRAPGGTHATSSDSASANDGHPIASPLTACSSEDRAGRKSRDETEDRTRE